MPGGGGEKVVGEFRQLSGSKQRRIAHQIRRHHLGVARLPSLQIEHKGAQRPLKPRQGALEDHEPCARHLGSLFEIHQAKGFAEFEMLLGREIELPWRAVFANFHIGAFIGALGHVFGGQVGDGGQDLVEGRFQSLGGGLRFGLRVFVLCHPGDGLRRVLALGLQGPDFLGERIAPGLKFLGRGQRGAPLGVKREQFAGAGRDPPALEAIIECFGIFADPTDVKHGASPELRPHTISVWLGTVHRV